MIQILGLKKVITLVLSLLIIAAAGATYYYYFAPAIEIYDKDNRAADGKIRAKRAEINQLKQEYALLEQQIVEFKILQKAGFFNAQDRITARDTIDKLARLSKLLDAKLNLSPGSLVQDPRARDANYSLISGPLNMDVGVLDDIDVYKFVVALQNVFPGYLEFKSLDLKRGGDLDKGMIKSIMDGKSDSLVTGKVQFVWWSMASQEQMQANPYLNPAALAPKPVGGVSP
jgi:hypothetical protein